MFGLIRHSSLFIYRGNPMLVFGGPSLLFGTNTQAQVNIWVSLNLEFQSNHFDHPPEHLGKESKPRVYGVVSIIDRRPFTAHNPAYLFIDLALYNLDIARCIYDGTSLDHRIDLFAYYQSS